MNNTMCFQEVDSNYNTTVTKAIELSRSFLFSAIEERDSLITNAKETADIEKENAYLDAHAQAKQDFIATLMSVEQLRAEMIDECKEDIARAVIEVAKEVIARQLGEQPESILARVERAITKLRSARRVKIFTNPGDAKHIQRGLDSISSKTGGLLNITLGEDSSIELENARLETELVTLTSSITQHLSGLESHLLAQ